MEIFNLLELNIYELILISCFGNNRPVKSKETFVAKLFTKLDEEGIGYSIIKGYETHPYYENDIDLKEEE